MKKEFRLKDRRHASLCGVILAGLFVGACSSGPDPVVSGSAVERDVFGEPILHEHPIREASISGGLWGE